MLLCARVGYRQDKNRQALVTPVWSSSRVNLIQSFLYSVKTWLSWNESGSGVRVKWEAAFRLIFGSYRKEVLRRHRDRKHKTHEKKATVHEITVKPFSMNSCNIWKQLQNFEPYWKPYKNPSSFSHLFSCLMLNIFVLSGCKKTKRLDCYFSFKIYFQSACSEIRSWALTCLFLLHRLILGFLGFGLAQTDAF